MNRRQFAYLTIGVLLAAPVLAHHGWSSFDQDKPLYLSGTLTQVRWQNPHAEVDAACRCDQAAGWFRSAHFPAQQQSVDAAGILKKVQVPANAAGYGKSSSRRFRACSVGPFAAAEGRRPNRSDRLLAGRRKQAACCASSICSSTARRTRSDRRRRISTLSHTV